MKPNSNIGLRQQIALAKTLEEIDQLLELGKQNYAHASFKTVRQWRATAARRAEELKASAPPPAPTPVLPAGPSPRALRRQARKAAKQ